MAVLDLLRAAGVRAGARPAPLLRAPANLQRAARGSADPRRTERERAAPARRGGEEDRVLRAELPFRRSRGRPVAASRRGAEEGRGGRGSVRAVRGIRPDGRREPAAQARARRNSAARPLSSEVDGPAGAGKVAARAHSRLDGRRSRRRLLRHGGLVRLCRRAFRRLARDRGAEAAAGRPEQEAGNGRRGGGHVVPPPGEGLHGRARHPSRRAAAFAARPRRTQGDE